MAISSNALSHQGVGATSSYSGLYLWANKFDESIENEAVSNTFCNKGRFLGNTLCFNMIFLIDLNSATL